MASKVKLGKGKEFTFAPAGGGPASKYPWEEWLNGDLLLLERSVGTEDDKGTIVNITEKKDYEVATDAMPAKLKTAARRRYKVVQISRRDYDGNRLDNGLIIQARDMTADERQAEDLLRAEEKDALKARKAKEGTNGQPTPAGTDANTPTTDNAATA